jgi:hypothetical protein
VFPASRVLLGLPCLEVPLPLPLWESVPLASLLTRPRLLPQHTLPLLLLLRKLSPRPPCPSCPVSTPLASNKRSSPATADGADGGGGGKRTLRQSGLANAHKEQLLHFSVSGRKHPRTWLLSPPSFYTLYPRSSLVPSLIEGLRLVQGYG